MITGRFKEDFDTPSTELHMCIGVEGDVLRESYNSAIERSIPNLDLHATLLVAAI